MAGYRSFSELDVYRLAEALADKVWELVAGWDYFAKSTVGRQLVRAADSIGANIAEGHGRGSYMENRRFVRIARGSLNETRHWLRRSHRRNLIAERDSESLRACLEKLAPALNGYLRSMSRKVDAQPTNPS
ncbi:MAG: four helix bundle protein [Planctomycetes bacterium]|nr:four helix bundle protein [Planctomycetota bacterium]